MKGQETKDQKRGRDTCSVFFPSQDSNGEALTSREKTYGQALLLCSSLCLPCMQACSVMSSSLRPHGLKLSRLLCSRDFSRQEYWSGLPIPPPGDLLNLEVKPVSRVSCIGRWILYLCTTTEALFFARKKTNSLVQWADWYQTHFLDKVCNSFILMYISIF